MKISYQITYQISGLLTIQRNSLKWSYFIIILLRYFWKWFGIYHIAICFILVLSDFNLVYMVNIKAINLKRKEHVKTQEKVIEKKAEDLRKKVLGKIQK